MDNRYVLKKLKVLLLSVLKKDWFRLPSEDEVKDDVSSQENQEKRGAQTDKSACRLGDTTPPW